uniref:Uncharacterized protein n=1 Tax=Solanum tuberosum TaxID=4113 RepID=M1AF69_SOLTU
MKDVRRDGSGKKEIDMQRHEPLAIRSVELDLLQSPHSDSSFYIKANKINGKNSKRGKRREV